MWDQEKEHLQTVAAWACRTQTRPTLLLPLAHVAGYVLGYGTALLGKEAAMACTEAVETVVGGHYNE